MDNWRAGLITAMVANTARDPKKHSKPYQPADFMPTPAKVVQAVDQDALAAKAATVFAAFGGTTAKVDT